MNNCKLKNLITITHTTRKKNKQTKTNNNAKQQTI